MATRQALVVAEEKKKRNAIILFGAGTIVATIILGGLHWILGLASLVGGGFMTFNKAKDWFNHRAKNGMYLK